MVNNNHKECNSLYLTNIGYLMEHFITYKGTNVHYYELGKGKSIVLLHGFLEDSNMWKDIATLVAKTHRVVCIDLLGHGKTEPVEGVYTMDKMAEYVKVVIDYLSIDRLILVGHSMGGYVSLSFAKNYPEMVEGLCLMNSTAAADSTEKKINRDRAIKAVLKNHKTFIRIAIVNLFRPKNRTIFSDEIKQITKEAQQTPLQGIVAALEGMKIRTDREALLHFTPFKKMLMLGKKDPVLNYNSLINQAKNTEVKIVEFPDGHMSHIENKHEFLQNLMHFIENI